MTKRTFCIYAEAELIELAKAKGINLSEFFNTSLKMRLDIGQTEQETLNTLNLKLSQIENTRISLLSKIKELENLEKEKLEKEKEDLSRWKKL